MTSLPFRPPLVRYSSFQYRFTTLLSSAHLVVCVRLVFVGRRSATFLSDTIDTRRSTIETLRLIVCNTQRTIVHPTKIIKTPCGFERSWLDKAVPWLSVSRYVTPALLITTLRNTVTHSLIHSFTHAFSPLILLDDVTITL